ncbi:MAG: 4Fe-4S dicluster domain-containing protein [Fermentimonas sp.]|jgi:polyferredoxin
MLKKIRLTLSVLFFVAVTLLFLDFTGVIHAWLGWTAKVQFLPALFALNVGVVVMLILLTLLFGRVYCSVICPLGVFQDIVSWFSGKRKKKKNRFSYSPEIKWLRYGVLVLFVIAFIAGVGSFVALLAPYSSYGRIASNLFAPVYRWGNNMLAYFAERADSYAFYETEVWMKSLPTFIIAVVTFVVLIVLAWRNGRTYCNTVCPVGTVLGFFSRYSLFRPTLDAEKCNNCSLCSRRCKASCIDYKNYSIDYSRCVACMNCLDVCKQDALHMQYRFSNKSIKPATNNLVQQLKAEKVDTSRRGFLSATALLATTTAVKGQEKKVDGGLAVIEDKLVPERATPIVPPGAWSARDFAKHCTACQLCVSACPNSVLRPSTELIKLMQPEMSYERGYCRPECTRCSDVCPVGAIRPVSVEDKSSIRIGHAVWVKQNCVPLVDDVDCGNCERHCPTGAIQMVPSDVNNKDSRKIPVVNEERCIGCGACETLCPARPFSAIYVEGHTVHSVM